MLSLISPFPPSLRFVSYHGAKRRGGRLRVLSLEETKKGFYTIPWYVESLIPVLVHFTGLCSQTLLSRSRTSLSGYLSALFSHRQKVLPRLFYRKKPQRPPNLHPALPLSLNSLPVLHPPSQPPIIPPSLFLSIEKTKKHLMRPQTNA